MSRKSTIFIAFLVNAALLVILFTTAVRSRYTADASKLGDSKVGELALYTPPEPKYLAKIEKPVIDPLPQQLFVESDENLLFFDQTELAYSPPLETITAAKPTPLAPSSSENKSTLSIDEQYVQVTVKKGDFLEKIAKANNTNVAAIMKANKMSSTQLKIGQVLKVPVSQQSGGQSGATARPHSITDAEYYIVREGDNPWMIANRNKIQLEELLKINGLDEQKAKKLRPGDKLKIR